jgi:SAM-dependent methyltransferase
MPIPDEIESRYYTTQGFDADHSRTVRSHYLQFVEGRKFLVELGSGRGEFLQAAQGRVDRSVGVDVDPAMVKQVEAAGFEAVHADVVDYLTETDHRPDAIFLAHVIEHLAVDTAFEMLRDAAAIIEPGGVIIVVTPNPACIANLTNDFWSDPTHQRLYTLDLLSFLLEQTGFTVTAAAGNPIDVPGPPPHLLSPPTLTEAWGGSDSAVEPRATIAYDEQPGMDGVIDELHRLRNAVEGLSLWQHAYDERLAALRHFAETTAERHDETLRFFYGPNEIYVVGERRP